MLIEKHLITIVRTLWCWGNSCFTCLVVLKLHLDTYHSALVVTLNKISSQYWIVNTRWTVEKTLPKCALCKIIQGKNATMLKTLILLDHTVITIFSQLHSTMPDLFFTKILNQNHSNVIFYFSSVCLQGQYIWKSL